MIFPRIAITLGDPAGIGPEIVAKAVTSPEIYAVCRPVIVGDRRLLGRFLNAVSRCHCGIEDLPIASKKIIIPGTISAVTGKAAYDAILRAVALVRSKKVDAIATAPISKAAFKLAGIDYSGHTELLAALSKTKDFAMMMMAGHLRTVMVTRHCPLSEAGKQLSVRSITDTATLAARFLKTSFRIKDPVIAVCALNPHAGEGGMLGAEEQTVIAPAIKALRRRGLNAEGPVPGDSAWVKLKDKRYDLLVAMYHDQAMIGLKCIDSQRIVNVTAGLPFIRTSPGHGTAEDIAGAGKADPRPMIEAIITAAKLCDKTKRKARD